MIRYTKYKRKKQLILSLVFSSAVLAQAVPFTESSVVVNGGAAVMTVLQQNSVTNKPVLTAGFDVIFQNHSGFTLILTHTTYLLQETSPQPLKMTSLLPIPMVGILAGYTYTFTPNFEYSITAGLGCGLFPDIRVAIPIKNSFTVYFTQQYGLTLSVQEQFLPPVKRPAVFINAVTIGIGALCKF